MSQSRAGGRRTWRTQFPPSIREGDISRSEAYLALALINERTGVLPALGLQSTFRKARITRRANVPSDQTAITLPRDSRQRCPVNFRIARDLPMG